MKKSELLFILTLLLFGFAYNSIHNLDFGFIKNGVFSFESTRLASSFYNEFPEGETIFPNINRLTIKNEAGSVFIEKSTDSSIHYRAVCQIYQKSKEKAFNLRKSFSIVKETSGDSLHIFVVSSSYSYKRIRISFFLSIPEKTVLDITNAFGVINISGAGNSIHLCENFGEVNIKNLIADVKIECIYSNINAKAISGQLSLDGEYSRFRIQNVNSVKLKCRFSDSIIKDIYEKAAIEQDYGKIEFDSIKDLHLHGKKLKIFAKKIISTLNLGNSDGSVFLEELSGYVNLSVTNCSIGIKDSKIDFLILKNTNNRVDLINIICSQGAISIKQSVLNLVLLSHPQKIMVNANYSGISIFSPKNLDIHFAIKNDYGKIRIFNQIELDKPSGIFHNSFYSLLKLPEIVINSYYGNIEIKNYLPN